MASNEEGAADANNNAPTSTKSNAPPDDGGYADLSLLTPHPQTSGPVPLDPNAKLLELLQLLRKKQPLTTEGKCNRIGCTNDGDRRCTACKLVSYCCADCQQKAWKTTHKRQCSRRNMDDRRADCCRRFGSPVFSQLCEDLTQLFAEHQVKALERGKEGGVDKVIALMHDMEAEFDASSFVEWDYLYDSRGRAKMSFLDRMVDAANPSEPQKMSSKFARMDTQTGTNCGLTFDWTPQRWLLLPSPSDEGNPAHILMLSLGNVDSLVQIQLNDDGPTLLEVPPGMVIFPIVSQTGPKGFIAIKTPTEKELTESFNIKPEDINTVCVGE